MEFVVIARYRARAGEEGRVEQALREMVAPTRSEQGNLDYQVLRDPADPAVFVLYERYTGEGAFEAHLDSPHFTTWLRGQVLPFLDERTRFDLVPLADSGDPGARLRAVRGEVADGEALGFVTRLV